MAQQSQFKPRNPEEDIQDLSTYSITIASTPPENGSVADAAVQTVSCYQSNCQPEFRQIKAKILEFWGKEILEIGV